MRPRDRDKGHRQALASASLVQAAVQTKAIEYKQGDATLVGFLAWDDAAKEYTTATQLDDKATGVTVKVNDTGVPFDATKFADATKALTGALQAAGYPKPGDAGIVKMSNPFDIFRAQTAGIIGLLFILVIYVTMVYGPMAAALVELFPTRIRYTSMSLPYHIGNGWFGGLLPTTAFAIVAQTGNMYNGLWYPIIIALMTFVIGSLFVRETKDVDIFAND